MPEGYKLGNPMLDAMTEEELADYLYEHREDESLWGTKSYPLTPAKPGEGLVWSMRISGKDLDEIAEAAHSSGGNVSEFFRSAALETARALSGVTPPTTPEMLKKKLAEAQKLVDELSKLIPPSAEQRVAEPKTSYGTRRREPKA
jgi:hypothetical protein